MNGPVRLRIDHLAVEIGDEARAAEAEQTVRKALTLLASRLSTSPFGASAGTEVPSRALDLIELGPVDPGWLAGPGAADRLADELYRRIASGGGSRAW